MASARPGVRNTRSRRIVGIAFIVAGSLWTLLWAAVWCAVWALTGAGGVALLALDWRFFGPTALGVAVLVVGIGLAEGGRLSTVTVSIVLGLAALTGVEWMATVHDEGPYPFTDVPRGGLIAYSATEGIRLIRSQGGRSWLVPGTGSMSDPVWAPDGTRLAAAKLDEEFSTFSFSTDGSDRKRLPFSAETTPTWSPDGRRFAVVEAESTRVRVVRLSDGVVETVLPIDGNEPTWSPDGGLIALQGDGPEGPLQLYVVRPDGAGLRRLPTGRIRDSDSDIGTHSASWAPDGRRLAFASDLDGDDDIYVIGRDGTGLRKITRNTLDDSGPTWSPDGRRIAFDRTDYGRDRTAIVVVDLATGVETELAHSDGEFVSEPAWQPIGDA